MKIDSVLVSLLLVGCSSPVPPAETPAGVLTVTVVKPDVGALQMRDAGGLGAVRVTTGGVVEWRAQDGRVLSSSDALPNGCEADRSFAVLGGDGGIVLFVPFDCGVEAGANVYVGVNGKITKVDTVPFNFVRPEVMGRSVFVVASAFAGRFEWSTKRWAWRAQVVRPAAQGGGGVEPEHVSLTGKCIIIRGINASLTRTEVGLNTDTGRQVDVAGCR